MIGLAIAVAMAVVAGFRVVVPALEQRLIYFPGEVVPSPGRVGLPSAETVTVTTADGLDLAAWFVPADGEPVGAVLVLHGNAGTRAGRARLAAAFAEWGLATMLLDYRGYGGNPGRPSQDGLLADARAGLAELHRRTGLGPDRTVIFGESLGSAVAAGVVADQPVGGLILRSPFPSLVAVGRIHYPWLPVDLLLRDRYPAEEWIARYHGPTAVIIGQRDDLIPPDLSRAVADRARGPVHTITVDGAVHNSPALLDGEEMLDGLAQFLRAHVGLPVRAPST